MCPAVPPQTIPKLRKASPPARHGDTQAHGSPGSPAPSPKPRPRGPQIGGMVLPRGIPVLPSGFLAPGKVETARWMVNIFGALPSFACSAASHRADRKLRSSGSGHSSWQSTRPTRSKCSWCSPGLPPGAGIRLFRRREKIKGSNKPKGKTACTCPVGLWGCLKMRDPPGGWLPCCFPFEASQGVHVLF